MAQFSQRSINVINDFAHQLQMPPVPSAPDGSFSFQFERAGLLSFTASEDGSRAILSLTSRAGRTHTASELRQHMAIAQYDDVTRLPMSAGLTRDGGLVLAANVAEKQFDVQTIERCLDRMIALRAS